MPSRKRQWLGNNQLNFSYSLGWGDLPQILNMSLLTKDEQKAVKKVVEAINRKRQRQIEAAYDPNGDIQAKLLEEKKNRWYQKPVGKAGWQKIATIPAEVDHWFTKVYGPDYYKEKDFFTKRHPEWLVSGNPRNK